LRGIKKDEQLIKSLDRLRWEHWFSYPHY
jgi:hypothetical protein